MAACEPCGARNQCAEKEVICINTTLDADETLECVDSFIYLGSVTIRDGSAQKDIKNRLSKPGTPLLI